MKKRDREMALQDSVKCIQPARKIRGNDAYADNPFLTGFSIRIKPDTIVVAGGLSITDKSNDEIDCGIIGSVKTVDAEHFLKLYTKNISIIFELNTYARRIFPAILMAVQHQSKDKAEIFLSHSEAVEYFEQLKMQAPDASYFSRGMKDLIKQNIIAYHARGVGWYWINPNIIFNGDRVRFISEYRIKRKKELEQLRLL